MSIPIIRELQIVLGMCYSTSLLCILWAYARSPFCAKEHISSTYIYMYGGTYVIIVAHAMHA